MIRVIRKSTRGNRSGFFCLFSFPVNNNIRVIKEQRICHIKSIDGYAQLEINGRAAIKVRKKYHNKFFIIIGQIILN